MEMLLAAGSEVLSLKEMFQDLNKQIFHNGLNCFITDDSIIRIKKLNEKVIRIIILNKKS
jgi:hypothetical protein